MTAEIINFIDFKQKSKINMKIPEKNTWDYIDEMQKKLSQEDYIDFLEASLDLNRYNEVDDDIKMLVDSYFSIDKNVRIWYKEICRMTNIWKTRIGLV